MLQPKKKSSFEKPIQSSKFDNYASASNNNIYTNTGVGKSSYDDNFNFDVNFDDADPLGSVNEYRANEQSAGEQVAKMVGRSGAKALTEVLKMPGYIGGLVAAPFADENEGWETLTNNWWVKGLGELNEEFNAEVLPVYVKKAVKEGNLWDNITSTAFWATEGADGIGYIASMFVPGAIFKSLGLGRKAMGMTAKGLSYLNGEQKLAGAVRTLTNAGITSNKFDIAGTALVNSLFESSAEAGGAIESMNKQKSAIIEGYKIQNPGMTDQQSEEMFAEQKGRLGSDVFKSNMAILIVPNLIQSSMIWGKAGNKLLSKVDNPSILLKAEARLKNIAGAAVSEGVVEEAGQSTVEAMFTNKAKKGKLTGSTINNFNIGELADNYLETVSSTEGQKAMFLGAFLGGGMSMYSGVKQDQSDRTRTTEVLDFSKLKVDNFNTIRQTDIYKRDEKGDIIFNYNNKPEIDAVKVVEVAKALQYTEMQQKELETAINEGNTEIVNELKQEAMTQLASQFIAQGPEGIQALKQHLEETSKAEEVVGLRDPAEVKQMITDVVKQATYMQAQLQSYTDFSKDLINLKNPSATKEELIQEYNDTRDLYIHLKGIEFGEKNNLKALGLQRKELIDDIGESNIQIQTDEVIDENSFDDSFGYKLITDPRVKLLQDKIEKSKEKLKQIDKLVNKDIWNSQKLNENFDEKIKQNKAARSEQSKEEEYRQQVEQINDTESEEELNKIKSDNPEINKLIDQKRERIIESERIKDEAIDEQNLQEKGEKEKRQADKKKEAKDKKVEKEVEKKLDKEINQNKTLESIETDTVISTITEDIVVEGNEEKPEVDDIVEDGENFDTKVEQPNLPKLGARVISTYRKTGEKIPFVSQEFIDYERNSQDKSKDVVEFEINLSENLTKEQKDAVKLVKDSKFENLQFLYENLPINAIFNKSVGAPLETITKSAEYNEIFKQESLPLRKAIVDALANGIDIKDISSNVVKQFQGQLKVQDQIELADGTKLTPQNSVKDLQFFSSLSGIELIKEIAKRAYFVHYDGQLTGVNSLSKKKLGSHKGKGEVFIEIPQNNGKPFMLKLNFKRIGEDKASGIYEVIKALSVLAPTEENPNPAMTNIQDFLNGLTQETQALVMTALVEEIGLIETMYPDASQQTIDRLLDLLVHQKSKNSKTLFKLDEGGNLRLGSLALATEITSSYLQSEDVDVQNTNKNIVINFLKDKRHNVLITESKGGKFTFNSAAYVNYLLDNNILSTNAVTVNEQGEQQATFQGYSNIYLNSDIQIKNDAGTTVDKVNKKPNANLVIKVGDKITAIKPLTKENIEGVIVSIEPNGIRKNQYLVTLDNGERVAWNSFNPKVFIWVPGLNKAVNKEDVKIQTKSFDVNKLSPRQQMKLIRDITKELNLTLTSEMLEKNKAGKTVEVFNELVVKANQQNKNIDEIIKNCAI